MTTPAPSSDVPLRPGESRRSLAVFGDPTVGVPTPAGEALSRVIAVREVCPAGARYAPPPLDCLTLFLTLHGRAQVRAGGRAFDHQPGALIAAASQTVIAERVAPERAWHVCYVLLAGPWANQMDAWLRRRDGPPLLACAATPPTRQAVTDMVDLALAQPGGWPWAFLSRCAAVMGALYTDMPWSGPSGDALVRRLADLLDAAPAERPSPAEIAARLGLTPRQLAYQFHKATGEPLARWVQRRRVLAARRLLSQGQTVTDVADRLGYANAYHFSRIFKAVTGVPPSRVRAASLEARLHIPEDA